MKLTQIKRLTGAELLHKINEMPSASMKDKARACGYMLETAQGERIDSMRWYEALAQALADQTKLSLEPAKAGRELSGVVSVQRSGSLLVGYSYLRPLGVKPGERYEIQTKKNGDVYLRRLAD